MNYLNLHQSVLNAMKYYHFNALFINHDHFLIGHQPLLRMSHQNQFFCVLCAFLTLNCHLNVLLVSKRNGDGKYQYSPDPPIFYATGKGSGGLIMACTAIHQDLSIDLGYETATDTNSCCM